MRLRWSAALMAALLTSAVCVSGAVARPLSSTKYTYYTISGGNAVDLYNAMIRRGPHVNGSKAYAATSAASSQQGLLDPGGKSCRIRNYKFKIDFTIKLPKFAKENALPAETRARWKQFSAFLRQHEETHRSIWLQCGAELEAKINGIRAKNCAQADKMAAAMWDQMRNSCSRKHAAFDDAEQKRLIKHPFVKLVLKTAARSSYGIAAKKKKKKKKNFASAG